VPSWFLPAGVIVALVLLAITVYFLLR